MYYHITPKKNIERIFTEGLIPGKRKGITINSSKQKSVFLTNDTDRIIKEHCGKDWFIKHDCVILTINPEGLNIKPVEYRSGRTYTISDFEFTTDFIPVANISW